MMELYIDLNHSMHMQNVLNGAHEQQHLAMAMGNGLLPTTTTHQYPAALLVPQETAGAAASRPPGAPLHRQIPSAPAPVGPWAGPASPGPPRALRPSRRRPPPGHDAGLRR